MVNISNYKKLYNMIAPHIADVGQVPLIKQSLVYQLIADKFNIFVCGSPSASAKSSYREVLEKIAPSFQYFSMSGHSTKVGLSEVVRKLREGLLHLDELGNCSSRDLDILRDVMQNQRLRVDKSGKHKTYDTKVNVYATCNPKGNNDKWEAFGNVDIMKDQIPVSSSFYRRFHISIFTRGYDEKEFDKVNRHKVKNGNPKLTEEDITWAKQKILELKSADIDYTVPEWVYKFLRKMKYFDDEIVMPITSEIMEGVVEVTKANAKLREDTKVNKNDWQSTLNYMVNCLQTGGLDNEVIQRQLLSHAKPKG